VIDFFNDLKNKYSICLNEQQKAAVERVKGPVLVLAGPGSGKTTVIIARTFYLVSCLGVNPDEILTVTFNKAAQLEMKSRYEKVFGSVSKATFSTLHSFCYSVVRDYEKMQGRRLKLIEGEKSDSVGKQRILSDIYREINGSNINEEDLETLANEIGFVKNKMFKSLDGLKFQTPNFEKIYNAYERYKKDNLLIDFDDMLTYCLAILKKFPDILASYKSRFRYFQVDEGQDLSKVQFEILKILVESEENNLFIVADDDQSIYGFRGAEPGHILELEGIYNNLQLIKLETNYRSSRNIVEISSKFIKNNIERYDKAHNTNNPKALDPVIKGFEDSLSQLDFLVEKIKEHQKENSQIAVLYRNNLSAIALVERLSREGISYKLKQNRVYFFKHWLIKDILAILRYAINPRDNDAFIRIFSRINRYISGAMVDNALKYAFDIPIIDAIIMSNDLKPFQVAKFHELKEEFNNLSKMSPKDALNYIEKEFRYFGSVRDFNKNTGASMEYLYNLLGILKTLAVRQKSVRDFLVLIDKLEEKFEKGSNAGADEGVKEKANPVILSTLHSSKGLEFDAVFMIDLANREIPGESALKKAGADKDDSLMEEERRLFYVGMTRARRWLYLLYPVHSNDIPVPRSTFVNEVYSVINGEATEKITQGAVIFHKIYGKGIITSIRTHLGRDVLDVDFTGRARTLDLQICLEKGIITF